jgi:hypothetical protein
MPPSIVTQKLVVSKEHYICPNQLFHKNLMCPKNTIYAPINCYTKTCVQRTLYMPPSIDTQKLVVSKEHYMPQSIVPQKLDVSKEHYICPHQLWSIIYWGRVVVHTNSEMRKSQCKNYCIYFIVILYFVGKQQFCFLQNRSRDVM